MSHALSKQPSADLSFFKLRKTHLLPASIQLCLLGYWALHWSPLRERLWVLAWLIPAALTIDCVIGWWLHRRFQVTLAAVPVTLSSMLFTNYPLHQSGWMLLVVTAALGSKVLLRRDGRHVFNPSVFGLATLGCLTLLGVAPLQDVAHAFSAPPNMTELILLLALIVQVRLPVVLVTVGTVLGLALWALVQTLTGLIPGGTGVTFTPGWAPIMLIVVLLVTDPSTSPKTPSARLMFGLICGLLMGLWGDGLLALGFPDYYGKVLAVPTANALIPWLNVKGRRLDARLTWLRVEWNRRHVAAWFACGVLIILLEGKGSHFSGNMHVHMNNRPALLRVGADGVPGCSENPVYCRPFSFLRELGCWSREFGGRATCGDLAPFNAQAMEPYVGGHWTVIRRGRRPVPR